MAQVREMAKESGGNGADERHGTREGTDGERRWEDDDNDNDDDSEK